jgi:glycosyltransferase involved in cell wall biosynthesis
LSKQVAEVRRVCAPNAPVVSFSAGQRSALHVQSRVLCLSGRRWLWLRLAASCVERYGEVSHVFGALDDWHLIRAVGRRPVVLTVALPGELLLGALHRKVAVFVVESERVAQALVGSGVDPERVAVIYPGVDLRVFRPRPRRVSSPFRVLFASSPSDPGEFGARGISLLVETARRRPDVEFVLLWRTWDEEADTARAFARLAPPPNVQVDRRVIDDMTAYYATVDAVVCPYAEGFGKLCPNSVVEGAACGRPVLVSETGGIAGLVTEHHAGATFARTPQDLSMAIDEMRRDFGRCAEGARHLAETHFDLTEVAEHYRRVYRRALRQSAGRVLREVARAH